MEGVSCMGVVGCRRNAFMGRLRPIPIRRPVDELEPVGNLLLAEFELLWVDVFGQSEDGWRDAPELARVDEGGGERVRGSGGS